MIKIRHFFIFVKKQGMKTPPSVMFSKVRRRRVEIRVEGGKGENQESFIVQRTVVKGKGGRETDLRTVRGGCFHTQ